MPRRAHHTCFTGPRELVAAAFLAIAAIPTTAATAGAAEGPLIDGGFGRDGIRQINARSEGSPPSLLLTTTDEGLIRFANGLILPGGQVSLIWHQLDPASVAYREGPYGAPYTVWPSATFDPGIRSTGSLADDDGSLYTASIRTVGGGSPSDPTTPVELIVQRLRPDGTLDPGFGPAVRALGTVADDDRIIDLALSADHLFVLARRPIAVGASHARDVATVWRLQRSGSFEAGYGSGGAAELAVVDRSFEPIRIRPTTDGAAYLVGRERAPYDVGPVIIVGGDPTQDAVVARLDPAGAPDTGFGPAGLRYLDRDGASDAFDRVAVRSDGVAIAAGTTRADGVSKPLVAAYAATGPVTTLFTAGETVIDSEIIGQAQLILDSAERPVVAANAADGGLVWRLTDDGAFDPGFAGGGVFDWSDPRGGGLGSPSEDRRIDALVALADGALLLQTVSTVTGGLGPPVTEHGFLRVTAAGVVDGDWNGGDPLPVPGLPSVDAYHHLDQAGTVTDLALHLLDDGFDALLTLGPDGAPRPDFGTAGLLPIGTGDPDRPLVVQTAADGGRLIADDDAGGPRLVRLLPDGNPDATFGTDGIQVLAGRSADARITALAPGPAGGWWVCGWDLNGSGIEIGWVALVDAAGAPVASFSGDGMTSFSTFEIRFTDCRVDGDGLVVFGETPQSGIRQLVIARYLADGSLDAAFGTLGGRIIGGTSDPTTYVDAVATADGWTVLGATADEAVVARVSATADSVTSFVVDDPAAGLRPHGLIPDGEDLVLVATLDDGGDPRPVFRRIDAAGAVGAAVAIPGRPPGVGSVVGVRRILDSRRFVLAYEAMGDVWLQRFLVDETSNRPPTASIVGFGSSCDEDQGSPCAFDLAGSDPDPLDRLSWTLTIPPANGSIELIPSGTDDVVVNYTSDLDFFGEDHFTLTLSDGAGAEVEVPLTVTVQPVNDPPVFTDGPTVVGSGLIGAPLEADARADDPRDPGAPAPALAYQWLRAEAADGTGASPIAGATGSTYVVADDDRGRYLAVEVTAIDRGIGDPASLTATATSSWFLASQWALTVERVTVFGRVVSAEERRIEVDGASVPIADDDSWEATTTLDDPPPLTVPVRVSDAADTILDGFDLIIDFATTVIEGG